MCYTESSIEFNRLESVDAMADTTLKAYYAYLDDLLNRRKYDEVVAHCQHILGKFPKNLGVLRRLAKAQLENGQYDEAMASFGRVLSYTPQDVDAYVGLSWVSRQRSQGDNAIYYLERAYEREPNNTEVVGLLREAYRLFHDRANAKLPSTSYMVARQQVRSGLSTQAVKTLQDALVETPNRTDLRLLLTDIYAQIGQLVDAAKSALAVLKELPDCVRANQVLATVWLGAGRPSDAQRLVARIEDVEPYLAYEVALGNPPPDDAVTLSMLEYRAGASAATNITPDWMTNLGDIAISEQPARPAVPTPVLPTPAPLAVEPEPDNSWLDMLQPTEDTPNAAQNPPIPGDFDWLPAEEDSATRAEALRHQTEEWVTSIDPIAPPPASSPDDWLLASAPPPAKIDDDWLAQLGGVSDDAEAPTKVENQWLEDIDEAFGAQTVIQRNDFRRYMEEHEAAQKPTAETPSDDAASHTGLTGLLSILSGEEATEDKNVFTGMTSPLDASHLPESERPKAFEESADTPEWLRSNASQAPTSIVTEEDPFAWMQGEDIEVVEPSTEVESFLGDALGVEEMGSLEPAQEDALAWAHKSGVDLGETDEEDLAVIPDDDPFAWMRESGIEFLTNEMPAAEVSSEPQLLTDAAGFDLAHEIAPFDDDFVDDSLGQPEVMQDPEPTLSSPESSNSPASGLLAFVGGDTLSNDVGGTMGDNNDIPDWLRSSNADEPSAETSDEGMDWLADLDSANATGAPAPQELPKVVIADDDSIDEAVPAWMAALEDTRDPDEISNMSTLESPIIAEELTVDEVDSGLFDTLTIDGTFEDPAVAPVEEAPSWVLAEPPTTVAVRSSQPEPVMPSVSFNPYDDLLLTAPPADDVPVVSEPETAEVSLDIGEPAFDLTTEEAPFEVHLDEPAEDDWLSALAEKAPVAPVVETESADFSRPMDDFSFEAPLVDETDDDNADDAMDFASLGFQVDGDAAGIEIPSNAADDFDWLSDAAPAEIPADDSAPFALGDETPDEIDWLSAAAPAEAAPSNFSLDDAGDDMNWLNVTAPQDGVTKLLAKEEDFSLSFLDEQDQEQPSTALGATFFDDIEDDSLPVNSSDAALFGLSFDTPSEKSGTAFNAITEDDDLFVAEETPVEISETSAISAPDWLNALAPGLEVDTDALDVAPDGEYLGGGRGDYGWLNALVDEEMRPPVMISKPRSARFPFATPPSWLQIVRDETHPTSPVADSVDFDANGLPDWLDMIDDDDDGAQKN